MLLIMSNIGRKVKKAITDARKEGKDMEWKKAGRMQRGGEVDEIRSHGWNSDTMERKKRVWRGRKRTIQTRETQKRRKRRIYIRRGWLGRNVQQKEEHSGREKVSRNPHHKRITEDRVILSTNL